MITTGLLFILLNLPVFLIVAPGGAGEGASAQSSLDEVRQLLAEAERSPSANLDDLRAKLLQARAVLNAAMNANADNPDVLELSGRIKALLQSLASRPRAEHPWLAEAEAVADHLTAAVKGGGSCDEINELSTQLFSLTQQMELTHPQAAVRFRERVRNLTTLAPVPSCIASVGP